MKATLSCMKGIQREALKTLEFEIFNEVIIIILSESGVGTDQRQNTCIPTVNVTILM